MIAAQGSVRFGMVRIILRMGEAMWEVERTAGASAGKGGPTIRRCMLFAKALGHGALCMANLFAFRATRSAGMLAATDPFGPDNDKHFVGLAHGAGVVVAARHSPWTRPSGLAVVPNLRCQRKTQAGHPGHPLYHPGDLAPVTF